VIRIVTDSSSDLPQSIIAEHRIAVVPLTIRFGDRDYLDGIDLSVEDFWSRIASGDRPETATPPVGRFHEAYHRLVSEGADGIVAVCLSGKMSGTAHAARIAADHTTAGIPIRVVDTGLVSLALGIVVVAAAERAAAGGSIDAVEGEAAAAAEGVELFAAIEDLDYLRRGGRIGGAAAFVGDLLKVKPLIRLGDGLVAAAGRARTRRRALNAIAEHVSARADRIDRIGVIHSGTEDLDSLLESLAELDLPDPLVSRLGPVVGTHAGPGAIGVVYRLGGRHD
jgi:DegV family protein with EDD domain